MSTLNIPLIFHVILRSSHSAFLISIFGGLFGSINTQAEIVTSVRPLGFIAAAIADGIMPVKVILPDGASPHNYALRPTDMMHIKKADLLVWVGPELEAFLDHLVMSLPTEKCITLACVPSVVPLLMTNKKYNDGQYKNYCQNNYNSNNYISMNSSYHNSEYNMHIWLSPTIAYRTAEIIYNRLIKLLPGKKKMLDNNLQMFKNILLKNDRDLNKILLPIRGKEYYVFHDAYGYFEKYYGLTPLGYFTINPEIQPGAQALHNIRTQLIKKKITCIFAESQFRPAFINAVARGTSVHVGILDPLGMGIVLDKDSYIRFLLTLSKQYVSCLEKTHEEK
ncbi:zinc ABC transporter substrate-binding protein ZnuA [Candidatus Curculioniphilus buchneri]|uniref:zinc ABC transporter substrate-binding protein ZnuA n=1 Tax=Candidatus Curculioniphilus buchneri TaxID=690594 RepID=UPI00376F05EB